MAFFGAVLPPVDNKTRSSWALFVVHTKEVSVCYRFWFVIEKIVIFFGICSVVFTLEHVAFTHSSKEPSSREKNFIMTAHYQKNLPGQQPIRARVL